MQFNAKQWACVYLILAILAEVLGLTIMQIAVQRGSIVGHIALYSLVAVAYVLLAKAVRQISVGTAYAIWEGSGIALITLVSWLFFAHELSGHELIGLLLVVIGIVLVHAGQDHPPESIRLTPSTQEG